MLYDSKDPTVALFTSMGGAQKAAWMVVKNFPQRVQEATPRRQLRQGEMLGYSVLIRFHDQRARSLLTNSDFERLH